MRHLKQKQKLQATISQDIRANLQVQAKKTMPTDSAYLRVLESTLTEWNSDNDE